MTQIKCAKYTHMQVFNVSVEHTNVLQHKYLVSPQRNPEETRVFAGIVNSRQVAYLGGHRAMPPFGNFFHHREYLENLFPFCVRTIGQQKFAPPPFFEIINTPLL